MKNLGRLLVGIAVLLGALLLVKPGAPPVRPAAAPVVPPATPAPSKPKSILAPEEPLFSSNPVYMEVRLFRIPVWDLEDSLLDERGESQSVTRFWYEGQPRRPDGKRAEMEVVGIRGGREILLYRGWLDGRAVSP